ncbi:MAG TPA: NUDIX domain-containing protein, partial [Anaeromyxobacteraceae bacterium]|nr:NUDIX domain-containing protein [Anaeromyxobacteraceae bacterium]
IVPCGIVDPRLGVTSLAQELATLNRAAPVMEDVEDELARCLADLLGRECEMRPPDLHTISVTPIGSDGRVLLLRRRLGGFWQPVTGRIESGETPEAAARRELFEETGAEATVAPLGYRHAFGIEPELLGGGARGPLVAEETAFVAHLPAGFSCRLSDEHTEHGWYRPPEALAVLHWEGLRRAVKLATASGIALR